MRIAIATIFDYPHPGGLSTHVDTLAAALRRRGHELVFQTPRRISPLRLLLGARAPSLLLQRLGRDRGRVWAHAERLRILRRGMRALPEGLPVIAEDAMAAIASRDAGHPTLLTVHGYLMREAVSRRGVAAGGPGARYLEQKEREGYAAADRILAVDQRIARYVRDLVGREDVLVLPNFIDLSWTETFPGRAQARNQLGLRDVPTVLCPRRLTPKNGVHVAVEAMAHLFGAQLCIVGGGAELDALRRLAARLGVSDRVIFTGALSHAAMAPYYAAADAVAIPSVPVAGVEEATSISAIEGMASGRPVVASAIGGLSELITDGETGFLVPPGDPAALAQALQAALDDAGEVARRARERIQLRHSADAAAVFFERLLQEIQTHRP